MYGDEATGRDMVLPVQEMQPSLDFAVTGRTKEVCEMQVSSMEPRRQTHRARSIAGNRIRHVYILGMTHMNADSQRDDVICKIGIADDACVRFHQIASAYKVDPKPPISPAWYMYAECYAADARRIESCLHRRYAVRRLDGEWFRLPIALINSISSMGQWDVPWPCVNPMHAQRGLA